MPVKFLKGVTSPTKKNYRSLVIRTYCHPEKLLAFLTSVPCLAWSYCTHDKDVDEDGNPHMSHTHCIVHFDGMQRLTKLAKYLDSDNTRVEPVLDKYKAYEYLVHANSPDKYQYNLSERHSMNESFYIRLTQVSKEERRASDMQDLLNDVLDLTMRDFALKYGRDGILHYSQYRDFAQNCYSPDVLTLASRCALIRDSIDTPDQYCRELDFHSSKRLLCNGFVSILEFLEDTTLHSFPSAMELLSMVAELILSCNKRSGKLMTDEELGVVQ